MAQPTQKYNVFSFYFEGLQAHCQALNSQVENKMSISKKKKHYQALEGQCNVPRTALNSTCKLTEYRQPRTSCGDMIMCGQSAVVPESQAMSQTEGFNAGFSDSTGANDKVRNGPSLAIVVHNCPNNSNEEPMQFTNDGVKDSRHFESVLWQQRYAQVVFNSAALSTVSSPSSSCHLTPPILNHLISSMAFDFGYIHNRSARGDQIHLLMQWQRLNHSEPSNCFENK